jgi:predicted transcriptional regulator
MSKVTSIRLEDDLSSQLDALAVSLDRPRTWVIEQATRRYVTEQAWQVQAIK